MSLRTQWPYAAKAIVRHEWVVNLLNVWVTFKFSMQTTSDPLAEHVVHDVKPDHDLWLCEVDDVPKPITVSSWQDEWTILLTVPDVLALPSRVTLAYDGPSMDLRITWDKQWEPWGPILSVRVPYGWEDILVVDTVNKRVGIQPGIAAADPLAYALTIVSPDGSDQIGIYHDNANANIRWTDGNLYLRTDEGTDTNTIVNIQGKGTGQAYLNIFDQDEAEYMSFTVWNGYGSIEMSGTNPIAWRLQRGAECPVWLFSSSTTGETQKFQIYGFKAGDTELRHVDLQISPFANNTALWSGVAHYVFDGTLAADELKVAGTKVVGAQGAAVADATGAGDIVLRFNELLAEMRTHGLIAT